MKKILLLTAFALPGLVWAQKDEKELQKNVERIIITKKGVDTEKLNIIIDGNKITVNGKPVEEGDDGDVTVKRLKIKDLNTFSWSPESGFGDNGSANRQFRIMRAPNKAMLGVVTEKNEQGAKVVSVNEETAAKKAGLKEGDIITKVDADAIETPDDLSKALKDKEPGDKIEIVYLRDGKSQSTTAELTKWEGPQVMALGGNRNGNFSAPNIDFEDIFSRIPRNFENRGNFNFRYGNPMGNGPKLGIKIQDIENGSGVKVIELEKGSDADKAGLKEGDIIKEANGNEVKKTDDLLEEKGKADAGDTLKLKVDRDGKSRDINILFSKKIKTADL